MSQEPEQTALRVLVVDDNIDSAESLAQILQLLGYRTCMAHDGLEALRVAETRLPRVAVLDIGLPGMNGHEVARHIRRHNWGKDMLLIALSGWGQEEDRRNSTLAGFDHHFVKPVDIDVLKGLLDQLNGD